MATRIPQNAATFSPEEVLAATSGTLAEPGSLARFFGVATDTREDLGGKIFVALRGEKFDGHHYLKQAIAGGATALIVSEPISRAPENVAVFRVADTLQALGDLAGYHRRRWGGRVVAVVGSAGKTTTRSVISKLLEEAHGAGVHSTIGNLNNRIGVPMILFGLTSEHDFAVVELGTNQPGEVSVLAQMAAPDVAVLTLIDLEHTEGLGSLDGVEAEESAVFMHLSPSGTAVGFGEDPRVLRRLRASGARSVSYGFDAARDVQIVHQRLVTDQLCQVSLRRATGVLDFASPLIGRPGALAAAAGVSAVEALLGRALTSEQCARALEQAGEPGRNQVLVLPGRRLVVDDTYNSNPASVENSVATGALLAERSGGRLWLVLGEMLELGGLSRDEHAKMGELATRSGACGVFFVQGDAKISWETAHARLGDSHFFEDAAEVAPILAPLLAENDVVVVKASRGVRAERVVQGLEAFYKPVPTGRTVMEGEGGGFSP
jgi:UDP-N-acetylmuramoyl-tripeptide--D-alanyl-D-alanine ligase